MAPLRSLKFRIAVTIFLLEGIMMVAVLWQTTIAQTDALRAQFDASEQALMGFVARVSRTALLTEEFGELRYYFTALQKHPRIERTLLGDQRSVVVASADIKELGQPLPPLQSSVETYWRTAVIANPAGPLGTLAMQFSSADVLHAEARARRLGLAIAVIGMSIIALAGILIGYLLTRRLEQLAQAAAQMAQGDLNVRTRLAGDDEVTEVGRAFNIMAENLSGDRAALKLAIEDLGHNREHLEELVAARTAQLEAATSELEAVSYSASHDLRTPLRAIHGFSYALVEECGAQITGDCADYLGRIQKASMKMGQIIDDMLRLVRITRTELRPAQVDLCALARQVAEGLQQFDPERRVELVIAPACQAQGDARLLSIALDNLLGNAWKFTRYQPQPRIEFGQQSLQGETVYYVRDNGVGFNMAYVHKLFKAFQRLHSEQQFEGTGVGLSIVHRVIRRHGGRVWAEAVEGKGATFYFTLDVRPALKEG